MKKNNEQGKCMVTSFSTKCFAVVKLSVLFLLLLGTVSLSAAGQQQKQVITGKVIDANGEPLAAINIFLKGSTFGTLTDVDGNYSMSIPAGTNNPVLLFSSLGFVEVERVVGTQTVIDVTMQEEETELNEVMVVGYGTQKKMTVTGAVAQIGSKEITTVPVPNTTKVLAGRVAGLFTKDKGGRPGDDGATLSIRGYGAPLILVDGIESGLDRIDPNEIESISTLKDAAAAIYGARAGNGVILVTTKRGADRPAEITYSGSISFDTPTAINKQVNAGQYAEMMREGQMNRGLAVGEWTEENVAKFKAGTEPNYRSYDWLDALLRDYAPMQQHNISMSGGTKTSRYFASVGFTDQRGIFTSDDYTYKRYNARVNIDVDITKNLTATFDLAYRMNKMTGASPMDIVLFQITSCQPRYSPYLPDPTKVAYIGWAERSPLATSNSDIYGYNKYDQSVFNGKVGLKYKVSQVQGLSASVEMMVRQDYGWQKSFRLPYEVYNYDWETEKYTMMAATKDLTVSENPTRGYELFPRLSVNYDRTFGDHKVTGFFAGEYIENGSNTLTASRIGLLSPTIDELFTGADDGQNNTGKPTKYNRLSYIGRATYGYKDKYLLDAVLRIDGSSNFPSNSRWGYFPGVSAGWRITEESFMESTRDVLSNLKLRLSYGESGYDRFFDPDGIEMRYLYMAGYNIVTAPYLIGGVNNRAIVKSVIPNRNITWEKISNYNVGIDFGLFNNQLSGEINAFYRLRSDILATPVDGYPSIFGASKAAENLNEIDNRGIEGIITYKGRIGDFSYSISPNLTYAREKFVKVEEIQRTDPDEIRRYMKQGNWTGRTFGLVSDGLFMSQDEIDNLGYNQDMNTTKPNSTLRPGDIRYKDVNTDGKIDFRDEVDLGHTGMPELMGGLALSGDWKGISVDVLFQGATNVDYMVPAGLMRIPFYNSSTPYTYHYEYRWQPDPLNPGQNINPNVKMPRIMTEASAGNNGKESDFWLKDGSYLRLKTINIGYRLPSKWMKKIGFKSIQIYGTATNLFTLTNMDIFKNSFDPEAPSGADRVYPIVKSYSVGLRMTL